MKVNKTITKLFTELLLTEEKTDEVLSFLLPKVNFNFNDFSPYMSPEIMELHVTKHHFTYVKKLNQILESSNLQNSDEIFNFILENKKYNDTFQSDFNRETYFILKNNFFGHLNHSFLWTLLTTKIKKPSFVIENLIQENFSSWENFIDDLIESSSLLFGSGWIWLVVNKENKLKIVSTENQDHVWYIQKNLFPILGLDIWEHAYYLDYRNDKKEYIRNFFSLIDWEMVEYYYNLAKDYFSEL